MFTLSMYAVECFNSSKEWIDFVLRFSQICFRTNSYADPNQLYTTNVNSNMHPLVHTELGLVQYISFQNPQYYFCSSVQKQHKRHVLYQLKTMDLGLFLQAVRNSYMYAKQIHTFRKPQPCRGGYGDFVLETAREAPTILYQRDPSWSQ